MPDAQHKGSVLYQRPPSVSTSKKTVGSLADITNVMHEQPTNNITKVALHSGPPFAHATHTAFCTRQHAAVCHKLAEHMTNELCLR